MAGKTLSDIEVFDLMCAEALCTYATTPPFGDGEETDGGFVRKVAERDGWKCTRPGCSNRTALTANHIIPRARGGPDGNVEPPHRLRGVSCRDHRGAVEGERAGSRGTYMGGSVRGDRKTLALGDAVEEYRGSFVNYAKGSDGNDFPRTAGILR